MKSVFVAALVTSAVLISASSSLTAHHGSASFDPDKRLTFEGNVTEWLWARLPRGRKGILRQARDGYDRAAVGELEAADDGSVTATSFPRRGHHVFLRLRFDRAHLSPS
jgi:hypothetical protein